MQNYVGITRRQSNLNTGLGDSKASPWLLQHTSFHPQSNPDRSFPMVSMWTWALRERNCLRAVQVFLTLKLIYYCCNTWSFPLPTLFHLSLPISVTLLPPVPSTRMHVPMHVCTHTPHKKEKEERSGHMAKVTLEKLCMAILLCLSWLMWFSVPNYIFFL